METKKEVTLPEDTAEADVLESIDCLLPLLQQLATQLPKRAAQPDRLVQKLAEQETTIATLTAQNAALEKGVATLMAEREDQHRKQRALVQALEEKEKEHDRQLQDAVSSTYCAVSNAYRGPRPELDWINNPWQYGRAWSIQDERRMLLSAGTLDTL